MRRIVYMKIRSCVRNTIVDNNLELDYLKNSFLKSEETLSKVIYELGFFEIILKEELKSHSEELVIETIIKILSLILSNRDRSFVAQMSKQWGESLIEIMIDDLDSELYFRINNSEPYLHLQEIYLIKTPFDKFEAFGEIHYIKDFK